MKECERKTKQSLYLTSGVYVYLILKSICGESSMQEDTEVL